MYIAQSGNLWLGGGTLYLYALGMGLPLILVTVFGNRLLPKSGPWMSHVKTAFGFVILALPVFLLERIFGDQWGYGCGQCSVSPSSAGRLSPRWALPGRGCGWYRSFCLPPRWSARGLCRTGRLAPRRSSSRRTAFTRVSSVAELDRALAQAKGQPVMLDLYADWCVACKEFENTPLVHLTCSRR